MSSSPKVSILLPNYNSGGYIHECIRSICEQSYADWEVVICDSGSTDLSRGALEQFSKRDNRVSFYDVAKEGIYPGWNDCLRRAKGEWIVVATADDRWDASFLTEMLDHAEARGAEHVACGIRVIDEEGQVRDGYWEDLLPVTLAQRFRESSKMPPNLIDALITAFVASPCVSVNASLFKRTLFERLGEFPVEFGRSGDRVWYSKVFLNAKTEYLDRSLADWRKHSAQATAQAHHRWLEIVELNEFFKGAVHEVLEPSEAKQAWRAHVLKAFVLPRLVRAFASAEQRCRRRIFAIGSSLFREPVTTLRFILYRLSGCPPFAKYRAVELAKLLK